MTATDVPARKRPLSREESPTPLRLRRTPTTNPPPPKKLRVDDLKDVDVNKTCLRPGVPEPVDLHEFQLPDRHSPASRGVDKDGHLEYDLGDNIGSRYKILSLMGEGTFGRVLECWDRKHKETVAIKVIRNIRKYREAAMIELEVLNTLAANDADNSFNCIHLRHWFDYRGHVCMVFTKLGSSLYDFLRRNGYRPFPLDVVMHFARQILQAVAYMHRLRIIHTDLKPENILLCENKYVKVEHGRGSRLGRRVPMAADIKVIDLGSATFEDQYHSTIVSTRHYRAPEVILGIGWSYPCDVWSVGCIIVELLTGKALFQTHDNLEHLAMMERVVGAVPRRMAAAATRDASKYFSTKHNLLWPDKNTTRRSIRNVNRLDSLKRMLRQEGDASILPHIDSLHDLLEHMIRFEPSKRMPAHDCLQHHFFRENVRSLLPRAPDAREGGASQGRDDPEAPRGDADHHQPQCGAPGDRDRAAAQGRRSPMDAARSSDARDASPSRQPSPNGKASARAGDEREEAALADDGHVPKHRRQGSPLDIVLSAGKGTVKPLWAGKGKDIFTDAGPRQAAVS